jgi:hypothetical protein
MGAQNMTDAISHVADRFDSESRENHDPIPALVEEWLRLWATCTASYRDVGELAFGDVVNEADDLTEEIEIEVSGSVATTRAGLVAQLLEQLGCETTRPRLQDRLRERIVEGIRHLIPEDTKHVPAPTGIITAREQRLNQKIAALRGK